MQSYNRNEIHFFEECTEVVLYYYNGLIVASAKHCLKKRIFISHRGKYIHFLNHLLD